MEIENSPENQKHWAQAFRTQCTCVRGNQTNPTFLRTNCNKKKANEIRISSLKMKAIIALTVRNWDHVGKFSPKHLSPIWLLLCTFPHSWWFSMPCSTPCRKEKKHKFILLSLCCAIFGIRRTYICMSLTFTTRPNVPSPSVAMILSAIKRLRKRTKREKSKLIKSRGVRALIRFIIHLINDRLKLLSK